MTTGARFRGFPRRCVEFYEALAKHNDRLVRAAQGLVDAGRRDSCSGVRGRDGTWLRRVSSGIVADARVGGSIFRINRDIRFSRDKRPYKTNLGILFWGEANRRRSARDSTSISNRPSWCFRWHPRLSARRVEDLSRGRH
jgi:uncharacterized protein (DUF2461 family)